MERASEPTLIGGRRDSGRLVPDRLPRVPAEDQLVAELAELAQSARELEGKIVAKVAQLVVACDEPASDLTVAQRHGYPRVIPLVEGITGLSWSSAKALVSTATATSNRTMITGQELPPDFPLVAAALGNGGLGLQTAARIVNTLGPVINRTDPNEFALAEAHLVCQGTGNTHFGTDTDLAAILHSQFGTDAVRHLEEGTATASGSGIRLSCDQVGRQAKRWLDVLDPDGIEPRSDRAFARREFTINRQAADGLHKVHGYITTDIAAKFHASLDAAIKAERGTTEEARTSPQVGADLFAASLEALWSSESFSTPPAVLIRITSTSDGHHPPSGMIQNEPAAQSMINQIACNGGSQEAVCDATGKLLSLTSVQRAFTSNQRKAIAARDGTTCLIPHCTIPATACEAHHVRPWAQGGRTEVDNGVMLCWSHHRAIDHDYWTITMRNHVPVVIRNPYPLRT